ncbi:hypothetical protein ACKWRH_36940 [Bradyrhizobium sp. Pa8]|uniref:hypothetical protein n=1 Tax=Bradyrhizobium sp. Pa8 TaxID=3386552 RepID=UPI00403F0D8F
MLIDALAKVPCPGRPPEELIFRSGHPTVLWKSTTLLHAVDADEHRIEERSCVCPHPTQERTCCLLFTGKCAFSKTHVGRRALSLIAVDDGPLAEQVFAANEFPFQAVAQTVGFGLGMWKTLYLSRRVD